jgi:16S rRNA (cytosine1402-N4)-methyltransferase
MRCRTSFYFLVFITSLDCGEMFQSLSNVLLTRYNPVFGRLQRHCVCFSSVAQTVVYHVPVMLNECLDYLNVEKDKIYVDCTLGGGGHTGEILKRGGKVIGIDQDPDAVSAVSNTLKSFIEEGRLEIIQSNFRFLKTALSVSKLLSDERKQRKRVDGILLDLGISSYQINEPSRGFSYSASGPLDMRMNKGTVSTLETAKRKTGEEPDQVRSAFEVINYWDAEALANVLYQYGEETRSRKIAREIISARPLNTTEDLEKVISKIIPFKERPKVLSRCFQALRIYVNDELTALDKVLTDVGDCLEIGGRLVVMSYHSLEDRRVKQFMKMVRSEKSKKFSAEDIMEYINDKASKKVDEKQVLWKVLTKKSVTPSEEEVRINYRSRSARLRAAMRIDGTNISLHTIKKNQYPAIGQKERIRQMKRLTELQEKTIE